MNNLSDSFEHFELISAYLDGEVTEEERAFIENNPLLLSEVEKLKEITESTSSMVPIDPVLQEKHINKALSLLPKNTKVVPLRLRKVTQRGALVAVAAAALAFILIPVLNSQDNESDNSEILATGFTESSSSLKSSGEIESGNETEPQASIVPESDEDSEEVAESPSDAPATKNSNSQSEMAPDENTLDTESEIASSEEAERAIEETDEETDEEIEIEIEIEIEAETATETETETETESDQITAAEISRENIVPGVFEGSEALDNLFETTNNLWQVEPEIFSFPLSANSIESFFTSNADFETCLNNTNFLETSQHVPLHLQRVILNEIPSLLLISESLELETEIVVSIYQINSSCSLIFEDSLLERTPSD